MKAKVAYDGDMVSLDLMTAEELLRLPLPKKRSELVRENWWCASRRGRDMVLWPTRWPTA